MDRKPIISVIVLHWGNDTERSEILRKSLKSLHKTTKHLRVEKIVVDNGGNWDDSEYLLAQTHNGDINTYIRNAHNLAYVGRNQGYEMSHGDYVVFTDNDIKYKDGWLESCLKAFDKITNKKIYASPIQYPVGFIKERYDVGVTNGYHLNTRAGSNCMMWRRQDLEEVLPFSPHRVSGVKFTDKISKMGYVCAVTPEPLAVDMGLRKGFDYAQPFPMFIKLSNRDKVYLNRDEYNDLHPKEEYI